MHMQLSKRSCNTIDYIKTSQIPNPLFYKQGKGKKSKIGSFTVNDKGLTVIHKRGNPNSLL